MKTYITPKESAPDELPEGVGFLGSVNNAQIFFTENASIPDGFRALNKAERIDLESHMKEFIKVKQRQWTRLKIDNLVGDIPSLLGKTANFTGALARIQLNIMSKLVVAQSIEDVRGAVEEFIPLMQELQKRIDAGEVMSVQSAQGMDDAEVIFEGLESLTKVARIFRDERLSKKVKE